MADCVLAPFLNTSVETETGTLGLLETVESIVIFVLLAEFKMAEILCR